MIEEFLEKDQEGLFEVQDVQGKGKGLIAAQLLKKGQFLLFYRGLRLSADEYEARLEVSLLVLSLFSFNYSTEQG